MCWGFKEILLVMYHWTFVICHLKTCGFWTPEVFNDK